MNAPFHRIDTTDKWTGVPRPSPSWPLRWEAAKGTENENAVLMSIAAEAHPRGEDDVFAAAYDAALARDPEERAEFIEALEELFREANLPEDDGQPLPVSMIPQFRRLA